MFDLSFRVFRLAYVNVEGGVRAELPLCRVSCLGDCLQLQFQLELKLYSEIIAVCSQIHTKHTNTTCGQNVRFP